MLISAVKWFSYTCYIFSFLKYSFPLWSTQAMDYSSVLTAGPCCLSVLQVKAAADAAKSLQSCLTLCDPVDGSPPGSPIPGILQARTLEWVAISFSNAWKWKVKVKSLSRVRPSATPWTAAHQAPPSMGFSRQEYWSGVPLPSPTYSLYAIKSTTAYWLGSKRNI